MSRSISQTMSRFLILFLVGWVAASVMRADSLVFKSNGDRLRGTLVAEEGDVVVFDAERFGVLRVRRDEVLSLEREAVAPVAKKPAALAATEPAVIANGPDAVATTPTAVATSPAAGAAGPAGNAVMAEGSAEAAQLALASAKRDEAKKARWRMHVAFSTELIHDNANKAEWIFELRAERKWEKDELRFEPRYEYKAENDRTTSDLLKLKTYYRHDIGRWWFVQYLPYYELNRQFTYQGLPLDYQYFRNEFGAGVRVIDRAGSILRVGVAKSFYDIELLEYDAQISLHGKSVFIEAELDLPWRVSIRDRGQVLWYSDGLGQGMGNELEITKHLNDVWWIGVRHEYRLNAPELQGDDLSKLKVFLGVDF